MHKQTQDQMIALLPRMKRFALGLCRNPEQAEDVLQDACVKAINSIDQWDPRTRLDSWLYRIVQTTYFDMVRTHNNRSRLMDENKTDLQDSPVRGEEAAIARLELNDVSELMDALPEEQRAALLLVSVEGCSYKDAAETLGIPMGTLTSRLGRARKTLLDQLDTQDVSHSTVVQLRRP